MKLSGTIEKAVEVLFHLHQQGAPEGVTSIGRALGLPKSTAHHLVTALSARGLVERTLVRGKDAELTSMETRETSGDATITGFRDVETGIVFDDAEVERIFSLRWPDEES